MRETDRQKKRESQGEIIKKEKKQREREKEQGERERVTVSIVRVFKCFYKIAML